MVRLSPEDSQGLNAELSTSRFSQTSSGALTDVTFVCRDGQRVHAHRPIMARVSGFLEGIFEEGGGGGRAGSCGGKMCAGRRERVEITLDQVDVLDMRSILCLIYTGQVRPKTGSSVHELRKVIKMLGVCITVNIDDPKKEEEASDKKVSASMSNCHQPPISETALNTSSSSCFSPPSAAGELPHPCPVCSRGFGNLSKLNMHLKSKHGIVNNVQDKRNSSTSNLEKDECEMAKYTSSRVRSTADASNPTASADALACRHCRKPFPANAEQTLSAHQDRCARKSDDHKSKSDGQKSRPSSSSSARPPPPPPPPPSSSARPSPVMTLRTRSAHKCGICQKSFKSEEALAKHSETCVEEEVLQDGEGIDDLQTAICKIVSVHSVHDGANGHALRGSKDVDNGDGGVRRASKNGKVSTSGEATKVRDCLLCGKQFNPDTLKAYLTHLNQHYHAKVKARYADATSFDCPDDDCDFAGDGALATLADHRGIVHGEAADFAESEEVMEELRAMGWREEKSKKRKKVSINFGKDKRSKKDAAAVSKASRTKSNSGSPAAAPSAPSVPCRKCHEMFSSEDIDDHADSCDKEIDLDQLEANFSDDEGMD